MALEATHIRFALDLKKRYKVQDEHKYILGSVYPDSRYLTGINREKTHQVNFNTQNIDGISDFQKGWLTHLICDRSQKYIIRDLFPELFNPEIKIKQGDEAWISITVLKILQDRIDVEKINVKKFLSNIHSLESPNDEELKVLEKYYEILYEMYDDINFENHIEKSLKMWLGFGVDNVLVDKIRKRAIVFADDESVINRVKLIYEKQILEINNYNL
ncbi:MAG: hypothetical protein HYV41_02800 [Candidatus Magasanikbacteria bacterium]|nr:hypothetical protein [Candidatus Magasanikbacteria bacterium]